MAAPLIGIQNWIHGVRSRMANDPGRRDLYDTIWCNGFLFLTEYMDDIEDRAQTEPIIELTKTPGRRKAASRKDRYAPSNGLRSRAQQVVDKENIPLVEALAQASPKKVSSNQFYQSLLKVGRENQEQDTLFPTRAIKQAEPQLHVISEERSRDRCSNTIEQREDRDVEVLITPPSARPPSSNTYFPPQSPTNHDIKFSVNQPSNAAAPKVILAKDLLKYSKDPQNIALNGSAKPFAPVIQNKEISFYIPKDPSDPTGPMATVTVPYNEDDRSFDDSEPTSTASSFPVDPYARDYETHELPAIVPDRTSQHNEQVQDLNHPSTTHFTRKASIPVLPNLPPPSPLRKSIRELSATGQGATSASISAAAVGKRTSWLHKTRDVTGKITVIASTKRKSDELTIDTEQTTEALGRAPKVAKTSLEEGISDALADKDKPPEKQTIPPFKPITKPKDVVQVLPADTNSEGMMGILKRTVDGLGARAGKSFNKSLGGAAATAAAAEAKAAAEARLAQREAKGSDRIHQPRLSVSELVTTFDGNQKVRTPDLPQSRDESLANKPSTTVIPASMTVPAIPKFQVQKSSIQHVPSVQLSPLASQPSQNSQPSTQSTYVSNLFDNEDPTWTQSSFSTEYTNTQGLAQNYSQGFADYKLTEEDIKPFVPLPTAEMNVTGPSRSHAEVFALSREPSPSVEPPSKTNDPLDINDTDIEMEDTIEVTNLRRFSPSEETESQNMASSQQSMPSSQTAGPSNSKRGKEPVKSIQLAAIAAKKQQEEADKKAARLEKMEQRRMEVASKKAAKRDRDDTTDRTTTQPLPKGNKSEDESTKKRKFMVDSEKKQPVLMKKPSSKDKGVGVAHIVKPAVAGMPILPAPQFTSTSKQIKQTTLSTFVGQSTIKLVGPSQSDGKASISLPKPTFGQLKPKETLDDVRQPSQTLHAQMQARVQAQILQAKNEPPPIPSESIELPEINSEYSDSEDEDRPRTFEPPDWAQSPVLTQALQTQSLINPDDIFGPIKPLKMGEIFNTRESRFRARTSSANWTGTDELTELERVTYAKRMGYVKDR